MRLVLVSLFALSCGGAPPPDTTPDKVLAPGSGAALAPVERMDTFTQGGYELSGAEYWPYVGSADIKYPEEVLWGFYPEAGVVPPGETDPNPGTARPEAVACARTSYAALRAFIASDPPVLRRIIELGTVRGDVVPKFYLWTNDYGRAADPYPPGMREARLWWWKRKQPAPPRPPGYWKWEATLTQGGACQIPSTAQIDAYLDGMLRELEPGVAPAIR